MQKKNKSIKQLLLIHEFAFILLICLTAFTGFTSIHLWRKSDQEANRINSIIAEVQQTRGDLYRQMKELFDAYFLDDVNAHQEYDAFTITIEKHFTQLNALTTDSAEKAAIQALYTSYKKLAHQVPILFEQYERANSPQAKHALNTDIETGLLNRYESIIAEIEKLLSKKQFQLEQHLNHTRRTTSVLLVAPMFIALILLIFSRVFLRRSIAKPIEGVLKATAEISAGHLSHKAPEEGATELVSVSRAINQMAEKLAASQETLIRSEKQAAQGLLVPMLAHNIRNPLASIRAIAQVMDDPSHDNETRESLDDIINTVDRLERWTGALLAYLLPLKPQISQALIQSIITGALAPLQQKIKEKSIHLTLPAWPEHGEIHTDPHLLEQVIYNLALNAVEASPKNGQIEVAVEWLPQVLSIKLLDRGNGMPFTPDPSASSAPTTKRFGTGLGIPFAFKVCDALGGELFFEHRLGGGTIVTLLLPKVFETRNT